MNLLPKHHDEFRKKEYWDNFFRERGDAAFEWYGAFKDLSLHCFRHIRPSDRILVIGCGNSDFSSNLYDSGYHNIVNIDFSEEVIKSMLEQNAASRPDMKWEVMDMTSLSYSDGSFDVVFDKGALDALMSTDSAAVGAQADSMFANISRVLRVGGRYMCVTLAEDYIISRLLASHTSSGFTCKLDIVTTGAPSPFKPLLVTCTKTSISEESDAKIELTFDIFGSPLSTPQTISLSEALEMVPQVQSFMQKRFDLSMVRPGERFEVVEIHSAVGHPTIPRFSIIVFDFAARAARSAAVFFVPSGRETEYQFSTPSGLADIAAQASCRRLIAVRCNKPHQFPPMAELQVELSPVALSLCPGDAGDLDGDDRIPYLAVGDESDWEAIETGELPLTGMYTVEELSSEECRRRLMFLENQQFVQTEVRLVQPRSTKNKSKGKSKGKKGSKVKTAATPGVETLLEFDYTFLDDHHRAMLVGFLLAGPELLTEAAAHRTPEMQEEVTTIPETLCAPLLRDASKVRGRCLVVGLGGGGLVMALQRYLPSMALDVVELVPGLEEVATKHFGFKKGPLCRVMVGDGLEVVESMAQYNARRTCDSPPPYSYDCIVLDVDSKDSSLGMSAPPKEFVTLEFLKVLRSLLSPSGVLSVNVVARSVARLDDLKEAVRKVFCQGGSPGCLYKIDPSEENVNITLHASNIPCPLPISAPSTSSSNKKGKKKNTPAETPEKAVSRQRTRNLESWLQAIGFSEDPLELENLIPKIENISN
mmetsp:Transcript_10757/g.16344  ORF Transcript_10757/g.16344 Transcript_10757/m.16344 type:complete len:761 (-) Transcript_10757:16-2298(-)|eukprot:CAMPEP_0185034166 /NCGR_PEP_ID=MMETSP1103-20130426/23785_1 /TAXON_ID=36769 /ORGANISM="Paraphysomonas bandaiensis, Strain Caron Lab Isolate" /LENGTH=760 /DNA_ID=CAMNT_0027570709 /DNA_START=62 /DNA_END=2344 /DNA_ORIENTATION=+